MAHFTKYTKVQTGHLCAHNDRSANNISNDKINPDKTNENYNLGPQRDISQTDFINQRCGEVKCLNRDNVNVMCSWLVTAPKDLSAEDTNKFFQASYDFLAEKYGDKNIISAFVHMDETQPHMHFAFVPVVEDKKRGIEKVSAKERVTRNDLQSFHGELDARMTEVFGRDIGVMNDATKDGNKAIEELKRGTAVEELTQINSATREANKKAWKLDKAVKDLETKKNALEGKLSDKTSELNRVSQEAKKIADNIKQPLLSRDEIKSITAEKGMFGAVKVTGDNITPETIEKLKEMSLMSVKSYDQKTEIRNAKKEVRETKKELQDMTEKYAKSRERTSRQHAELYQKDREIGFLNKEIEKRDKIIDKIPKPQLESITSSLAEAAAKAVKKAVDIDR